MNDKPKTWNIPVRTAEGKELQRKYAEAWPGLEGAKAMIQLNLDDIEAVLDRANDDADRVSVYEERAMTKTEKELQQKYDELYRMTESYIKRLHAAEAERDELKARSYTFRGGYIEDAAGDRWWSADLLARIERERDELKTRLAHAEADAEQAIHNEAFMERQRIVDWIRARIAHLSLDSRTTMQALDALRAMADEIERGEHER